MPGRYFVLFTAMSLMIPDFTFQQEILAGIIQDFLLKGKVIVHVTMLSSKIHYKQVNE